MKPRPVFAMAAVAATWLCLSPHLLSRHVPDVTRTWFTPTVVPENYASPIRLEVATTGSPASVAFEYDAVDRPMYDDGTHGDLVAGNGVWTIQFQPSEILNKVTAPSVFRPFIGFVEPSGTASRFNVFAEVWSSAMGLVSVQTLSATSQRTDYILNQVVPTAELLSPNYQTWAQRFYPYFADRFDFLNFVHIAGLRENRFHSGVKNTITGIGLAPQNVTASYGSSGRLQGFNAFPISSLFDTASLAFNHEIGHQWINFLSSTPYVSGVPHWPKGNVATGVMGFSIPGSNVGGTYGFTFTPNGSGGFVVTSTPAPNATTVTFNAMELYLMGLASSAEVPTLFVLNDQNLNVVDGQVLSSGQITSITIGSVVAAVGARAPDVTTSQKAFRTGTVVESEQLLDVYAMSFYDWFARRAEQTQALACAEGFAQYTCKPFYLATGGRATMASRLSPLSSDVNGDGSSDLVWRNSSNGANVAWYLNGTTLGGQASYPTVTDQTWNLVASADIDDDGHVDLVWRNSVTGANVVWYMNGSVLLGQASLPTVSDLAWQIVAVGDVNRDGHPDLFWRNVTTGLNIVWYLNGVALTGQAGLPTVTNQTWQVAASADMNLDGSPDLIWRNTVSGANLVWYLSNTAFTGQASLPAVADPTWRLMAAQDANQDGRPDLIWRNVLSGANVVWIMNGVAFTGQIDLPSVVDPTWQLAGATLPNVGVDVNGDRRADLIWRNTSSGANLVWYLNGTSLLGQSSITSVADQTWQIFAKADINGDTHPDLIWRNTVSGANLVWYLNGAVLLGQASLPSVPDPNWRIVAATDINADTHPDLVWRNTATGANLVWYLNGVAILNQVSLPTVADLNWKIVAAADINGDTHPDLIWRNASTGANLVWYLNGVALSSQADLPLVADTNWQIATSADVNGDGHPDLIWRNLASGLNIVWYLNGVGILSQVSLPTVSDLNWTLRPSG